MLTTMAPHGRELSENLRKGILSLHRKGQGYTRISKTFLLSQITVAKVIQKFKDGRQGRGCKFSPCDERDLLKKVQENQQASATELAKAAECQAGVTVA